MFYYSYDGQKGETLKVQRNDVLIEEILTKEKEFFNFMQTSTPPVNARLDSPWLEYAAEWKEIQRIKQNLKEQEDRCRETLIALTENGFSQGGGVRITQYSRKGRIAYDKIPLLKEMDLESYRQETVQAWKITAV